jgi:hypothetical protein
MTSAILLALLFALFAAELAAIIDRNLSIKEAAAEAEISTDAI